MTDAAPDAEKLHHHAKRMEGRDPEERHRSSSPLEALFDLTFVLCFGFAASQYAHALAAGHYGVALAGFALASFAICWAWINFTWFASAYDTDDWLFRLTTMLVMIGALVFAIGVPHLFASLEHGDHLAIGVIVLGYLIMRVGMVLHWLRAAGANPERRRACLTYAGLIAIVQFGWALLAFAHLPVVTSYLLALPLVLAEMAVPVMAERRDGGTPWHAHHIAERFSLFAIIALGESVVGTVTVLSAAVEAQGWSLDAALVCLSGVGLTFGLWWVYYILPAGPILHAHRERGFVWGYVQMLVVAAIVATGAGLDVAAYHLTGEAHIGTLASVLAVALPVSGYLALVYALQTYMLRTVDPLHVWLLGATAAVIAASIAAALGGAGMALCLVIVTAAPVVTVLGYELLGHRHQAEALAENDAVPEV